jgi:hypothetical protein
MDGEGMVRRSTRREETGIRRIMQVTPLPRTQSRQHGTRQRSPVHILTHTAHEREAARHTARQTLITTMDEVNPTMTLHEDSTPTTVGASGNPSPTTEWTTIRLRSNGVTGGPNRIAGTRAAVSKNFKVTRAGPRGRRGRSQTTRAQLHRVTSYSPQRSTTLLKLKTVHGFLPSLGNLVIRRLGPRPANISPNNSNIGKEDELVQNLANPSQKARRSRPQRRIGIGGGMTVSTSTSYSSYLPGNWN